MDIRMVDNKGFAMLAIVEDGRLHDAIPILQRLSQQQIGSHTLPPTLLVFELQHLLASLF